MAERPPCPADDCWDEEVWCEGCQTWHAPGPCEQPGPWWEWPEETITLGPEEPPAGWLADMGDDGPTERELAEWEERQEARAAEERAWERAAMGWPMAWLTPGVN